MGVPVVVVSQLLSFFSCSLRTRGNSLTFRNFSLLRQIHLAGLQQRRRATTCEAPGQYPSSGLIQYVIAPPLISIHLDPGWIRDTHGFGNLRVQIVGVRVSVVPFSQPGHPGQLCGRSIMWVSQLSPSCPLVSQLSLSQLSLGRLWVFQLLGFGASKAKTVAL